MPDDELRERLERLFREELQDNLRILLDGLSSLEREPAADATEATVPELFRAAHSLKGAAHSAGIVAAVEPCRRLEDALARLRDGELTLDDSLLVTLRSEVEVLSDLDRELAGASASAGSQPSSDAPPEVGPPHRPVVRARISAGVLDELVDQVGALIAATQRLDRLEEELQGATDGASASLDVLEGVTTEVGAIRRALGHAVQQVGDTARGLRMQRFDEVASGLEHAVAEVARATGKQARLSMSGGDVTVDRDIGDALREPLLHLVRNAVDHGVEPPEERRRAGKPVVGSVEIGAVLDGGRVRISVADDGRGVDLAALSAAAGVRGPGDGGGTDLAFLPGVSTAAVLTDVSGRGIGLDAVRARVESLGGTVHLRSGPDGGGTEAVVHVPTTLAVLRVLLVTAGEEHVAIPAAGVRGVHRVEGEAFDHVEGRLLLRENGRLRPASVLGAALGFPVDASGGLPGVVIELVDEDGVLLVDRVETELEVLLHQLPPRVTGSASVLGAVLLPSDRAALVINPSSCLRAGGSVTAPVQPSTRRPPVVLLAEDTVTTRALEHSILAGAGYEVVDAVDGTDAWRLLNERPFDLVVSDVDMPGMGGVELCRAIRSSTRLGHLPVVLVTSLASDEDRRRGLEAGANAYLVKSAFDQATLLEAVGRLL